MSRFELALCTGAAFFALGLISPATAQEDAKPKLPEAGSADAARLLDKACEKMLSVGRGAFTTIEEQDNPLARQLADMMGGGGGETEVEGQWVEDVVHAIVNDDGDSVLMYGGRAFAPAGNDRWVMRGSSLPGGAPIPHVLQPRLLFQMLLELPTDARLVRHVETVSIKGTELVVLGLTLENDYGPAFEGSGVVPGVKSAMGGAIMLGGLGGGGMGMPQPDVTVDVALFVEPTTGDVHRVRVKAYKEGGLGGNIKIAFGGPGGDDLEMGEEEEEPEEAQDEGALRYKQGLPLRRVGKDRSMMYLRADFSSFGKAEVPELDERARRLAGVK